MARSQPSFVKRQREQQKRERAQAKAEKRAQRKTEEVPLEDEPVVRESPIEDLPPLP